MSGALMRPRSLRLRAFIVVLIVVIAPLVFVWASNVADYSSGWQMQRRVERTAERAAVALEDGVAAHRLAEVDSWRRVRLRVLSADGQVVADIDNESLPGIIGWVGELFFDPDSAPSLSEWERRQPALSARPEILKAQVDGYESGCIWADNRKLMICYAALQQGEQTVVVHESSRRAIRALYDVRYQLIKLAMFTMALGILLAGWLSWRMVRPLEALRAQVLARKTTGTLEPVVLDRDDEFGDLAAAFNVLLGALEARNRNNEAFAADLVHELKNPVAAVAAAADSLESGRPLDAARAARLARVLRSSSSRLDALASRFLELARAEAGLRTMPRDRLDLAAMAAGLLESVSADERFTAVEVQLSSRGPSVIIGGSERLETALRNLLDNAARFAAERVDGRVVVVVTGSEDAVVLSVTDNGAGIPEADLPRLFERFFSRRKGGTGLGLALTRAIVIAHGGTITVTSKPDEETTFTVTLPAAEGVSGGM
ncbi:MAG: HAMP domain-containing sensor histidine kinase [Myxococcota bacterium]|nr:HAMP domain-containing sensor histidine kinase [Myxococcota bacterium]